MEEIEKGVEQCKSLTGAKSNCLKMSVKTFAVLKQKERQKIFDIMKANSKCEHEGDILRRCYAKSKRAMVKGKDGYYKYVWEISGTVVSVECCLKNCVLFPKEV